MTQRDEARSWPAREGRMEMTTVVDRDTTVLMRGMGWGWDGLELRLPLWCGASVVVWGLTTVPLGSPALAPSQSCIWLTLPLLFIARI